MGAHSAGLCFSTTFPWFLYREWRKEQAQPQLRMAALREQSTWNPEERQRDRWSKHIVLNRHVQCTSDFQFGDISINSLGNFKERRTQEPESSDVANIREELEKSFKPELNVSAADALDECEIEYNYQDTAFTLNLAVLWGSFVEETEMLKKEEAFYENCLLVKQEGGGRLGFSKRLVQAPSLAPCCNSTRSLFALLNRKWQFRKGHTAFHFNWLPLAVISRFLVTNSPSQIGQCWNLNISPTLLHKSQLIHEPS